MQPASHKINVVNGQALPDPLPDMGLNPTISVREPADKINVTVKLAAAGPAGNALLTCIAVYDQAGNVTGVPFKDQSGPNASFNTTYVIARADYPTTTHVRVWIYAIDQTGPVEQRFRPFVTELLPIFRFVTDKTPQVSF
jgi:hypothetical protein